MFQSFVLKVAKFLNVRTERHLNAFPYVLQGLHLLPGTLSQLPTPKETYTFGVSSIAALHPADVLVWRMSKTAKTLLRLQKYNYFLKYAIVDKKNDSDEAYFMIRKSYKDSLYRLVINDKRLVVDDKPTLGRPTDDTRGGRAEDSQLCEGGLHAASGCNRKQL